MAAFLCLCLRRPLRCGCRLVEGGREGCRWRDVRVSGSLRRQLRVSLLLSSCFSLRLFLRVSRVASGYSPRKGVLATPTAYPCLVPSGVAKSRGYCRFGNRGESMFPQSHHVVAANRHASACGYGKECGSALRGSCARGRFAGSRHRLLTVIFCCLLVQVNPHRGASYFLFWSFFFW